MDPFEWLGYFRNAEYILTSTFHGTLFAIQYGKKFAVSMNPPIRNKTEGLLAKLGLSDHALSGETSVGKALLDPTDDQDAERKLEEFVGASKSYLNEAVSG